ncbi:MAG: hypothetical protein ACR2RB_13165 [Gammaproteobacteria bacterium]
MFETLAVANAGILIFLMISLLAFVKARFKVSGLDMYIYLMIALSVLLTALDVFATPAPGDEMSTIDVIFVASLPVYGVLSVVIGLKLWRVAIPYRHLRSFAMLNIIIGAMLVTVIFALLAVVLGFVWDILLAALFFEAAREVDTYTGNTRQGGPPAHPG